MNANELAAYLEDITDWEESPYRQAATMLRQQQKQIDKLTAIVALREMDIEALKKAPIKYCPSEDNAAYEKGFIDGMSNQRDSAVQRFVEGSTYKPPIVDLCLRTDKYGNVLPQQEIK